MYKPTNIDTSIQKDIFWLYEHGYHTVASCSGLRKDHSNDWRIFQFYTTFVPEWILLKQLYVLAKTFYQFNGSVILDHKIITRVGKITIKLLEINYFLTSCSGSYNKSDSISGSRKAQKLIAKAYQVFFQLIQKNHKEKFSNKKFTNPQWPDIVEVWI